MGNWGYVITLLVGAINSIYGPGDGSHLVGYTLGRITTIRLACKVLKRVDENSKDPVEVGYGYFQKLGYILSKNFPTYPWNIPQTPNQQFMKEFLSFGGLGIHGVCSRGMLGFS